MVVMLGAWAQTAPTKQSNGTWTFTMPDANQLLEVEYYPCTLTVNPGANGTVAITSPTTGVTDNGNGSYSVLVMPGTEVTVTATADEYNHFVKWTNENNDVIGSDATKTFTVTGDTTLTATFAIDTVRLDSVRLTWQVKIGDADPISPTPYVTENPTTADTMGYVLIPKNADVVITPSDGQKELVSKLDLIPIGAINGKFSVGSNKQVYFSKGNLQATTDNDWTNWTFSFMEHQYSMVETLNQNVGVDYNSQNVVSLFGWGTSGYNHGATCYQPNCTNIYPQNYYAYGDSQKSLFDESGKADWGYNAISNGGNTENSGWRTLTNKEWVWLLGPTYANSSPTPGTNCRTSSTISGTPNARFAKANLFGTIHGLIIFPDNYTHPEGVDAPTGINMKDATSWNANTYTSADWAKMEAAGAVFLPAAGRRPTNVGSSTDDAYTVMYVGNTGCYWSSTDSTNDAQQVLFGSGNNFIVDGSAYRSDGHSVRLVKMATVSASAQTDPYVPARNSDNSWTFKMPTSDLMLRTTWKQDAGLAYAKADTTVYRGLTSTVQNTLTKPNGISVTYSITPESGTTTNNVINPSTGEVTIHGTGIDTVKARFAGNNDYLPDSAMYILRTLEPWKLTLATVGDGTVVVPPSYTLTFSGTDNNYNPIVVNNYDGTSFSTSTLGNSGMEVSDMLSALYGSNSIDPASCTPTEHVSTSTPWIVVTGTFSTAETMIFTDNNLNNRTITVSCTPNMNGIDVDPNNSNKYYVVPGTEVTVKATANEHYHFTKWTSGSTEMALTETMSFTVTSDTTVTANFAGNVYTVTANTNGNGSVTGGGSITYPNSATLVATANEHYHFVNWTSPSNTVLGTETTLVVQPTSDSTVNANFAIDTFELSFGPLASSQEAIDAHGSVAFYSASTIVEQVDDDTYKVPYGTKVTLKATPDADYHLRSWTYSNSSMTHVEDFEQDTTTITVTGAQTVTGNFAIDSSRIDSVRLTWQVQIGNADPISPKPYVTENPTTADTMGYVMIPIGAEFLIIPSDAQKELVSKLELIEPCVGKLVDLSSLSKDTVLTCGDTLTGTLAGNYKISIADGATVTLNDVSINYPSGSYYESGFAGITCLGDATIILKDGTTNNVVAMDYRYPGIQVGPIGKTLTIQGTGTLNAKYRKQGTYDISYGCGIGGGGDLSCGNIVIDGGTINAEAFHQAAGIGSGCCRTTSVSCGTITINGGIVTATGGVYAAGIGTGYAEGGNNSCGAISINGGTITATGGQNGAGIGTGDAFISNSKTNTCASITITDGVTQVTATKGSSATNSIGAGNNGTCGTITIDPSLSDVTSGNTRTISHTPSVPTGAINGKFTVNAGGKQVWFSRGNLQAYNATVNSTSGWVWSFAEKQWDYIGSSGSNQYINGSMTISQAGYVDLFCWVGASASHDNYGIIYDTDASGWGHEGTNFGNSTNDTLKHDWGHNPITNGGNEADIWRTPTNDEWAYLINSRTTAAGTAPTINGTADARYAKAKLFGTNRGLIIFPDTYVHPDGVAYPTGINAEGNTSWNGNQYSADDWAKMEAAGCVFLPCAGIIQYYTQVNDKETRGFYASSTPRPDLWNQAKLLHFTETSCNPSSSRYRRDAGPVRLVQDVPQP